MISLSPSPLTKWREREKKETLESDERVIECVSFNARTPTTIIMSPPPTTSPSPSPSSHHHHALFFFLHHHYHHHHRQQHTKETTKTKKKKKKKEKKKRKKKLSLSLLMNKLSQAATIRFSCMCMYMMISFS
ncbi:hypothetical protein Dsin_007383 [Dipteronia sinensis]|uniref:Uncharacterized protein n=1 Tax=Dipteronia sinensis TaxID=43782 RepID=A0AAE0B0E5_9ROSI|nr:hypothetical protein Dsin_007383 [Dipteronia sinensis]